MPLLAQGRVLGVLSLYDREDGEPFTLGDAEALTAFAVQAAVAIENVQLHAEAERLSVTDPLTGAWNYRYFERRFEQEIERSRRFGRVLALLMLDIDHFKAVNDRFGHQRGDEVLVEFRGPGHRQRPRHRHLRPLRRRGVRAHPARDQPGGRPGRGREAARGHPPDAVLRRQRSA